MILVTGAAGFIGFHVAARLLARGERVVGVDTLDPYYDVALKEARRDVLLEQRAFSFAKLDIADTEALGALCQREGGVDRIVHLAAQPGVRYSLTNPMAYVHANLTAHVSMLELARHCEGLAHFVYASSSSVYAGNTKVPFAVEDRTDTPLSLYGATKKADEVMTHAYAHLYRLRATGLRFFTVYGPWGRPDMAPFLFTRAILAGEPIRLFNHGEMERDFTYIDDIVDGVVAALDRPPANDAGLVPHRLYNLGNSRAEKLRDLVAFIEAATGRHARIELEAIQPGDPRATVAEITASTKDLGFVPRTPLAEGIPRLVAWYRSFYGV